MHTWLFHTYPYSRMGIASPLIQASENTHPYLVRGANKYALIARKRESAKKSGGACYRDDRRIRLIQ